MKTDSKGRGGNVGTHIWANTDKLRVHTLALAYVQADVKRTRVRITIFVGNYYSFYGRRLK